jgi:hypothetical protein
MKCNVNVKIGDVDKMCEEGVRRCDWPIGRVVDVFPGQDEIVRVVNVGANIPWIFGATGGDRAGQGN